MHALRVMCAVSLAVAVAVTPIGSVSAARNPVVPASTLLLAAVPAGCSEHEAAAALDAAAMSACDRMGMQSGAKVGGASSCPCCDTKSACPPELCPFKFFKVVATLPQPGLSAPLSAARLLPSGVERPPDWSDKPQPPPPRA